MSKVTFIPKVLYDNLFFIARWLAVLTGPRNWICMEWPLELGENPLLHFKILCFFGYFSVGLLWGPSSCEMPTPCSDLLLCLDSVAYSIPPSLCNHLYTTGMGATHLSRYCLSLISLLPAMIFFTVGVAEGTITPRVPNSFSQNLPVIMTLRVWALWGRRRDIGILLFIVFVVDSAAFLVAGVLTRQTKCQ